MKSINHLLLISFISLIALLAIVPGCDTLVTEEYADTTFIDLKIESVFVYIDTNYYYDTIYIDTVVIADSSCVTCHLNYENEINIAKRQWNNSSHASLDLIDDATGCGLECHSQEAFIASVKDISAPDNSLLPIDCFSCHNPHEPPTESGTLATEMQMRTGAATVLASGDPYAYGTSNICARCHQSTESINSLVNNSFDDTTTWTRSLEWEDWEVHGSSQANHLFGAGGYELTAFTSNSHNNTITANGCNSCHYDSAQGFTQGGHSFNLYDGISYSFSSCNGTGCHTTFDIDSLNYFQATHDTLLDSLGAFLYEAGLVDSIVDGIEAKANIIDATGLDTNLVRLTYNYFFIENDKSRGIHNWVYDTTLMSQSIYYVDSVLNFVAP